MPRPLPLVAALILAAAIATWLRAVVAYGPSDFDDAYMFARYAQHLLAGEGLRWNPGAPPVNGVTSLPHVLVVAGLRALAGVLWPTFDDGRLLQVAAALAALAALAVLARAVAAAGRRDPLVVAAALAVAAALSDACLFHTFTGMDTMLALLANAWLGLGVVRLVARPTPVLALRVGLLAFLSYLVRPDNILVAALTPALALGLLTPPPRRRSLRAFALPLLALVALDLGARHVFLGSALPLSLYAKVPGAYAGYTGAAGWNPYLFLRVFLLTALPSLLIIALLARASAARALVVFLLPVALTAAALFGVTHVMGHLGRFFFPSLPLVVIAAAHVLPTTWPSSFWRPLLARAAAAIIVIVLADRALLKLGAHHERVTTVAPVPLPTPLLPPAPPLPAIDSWDAAAALGDLLRDAPAGTRAAMSEHGLPGARAPHAVIIDVLGLHDPDFARGFDLPTLWRREPQLIWFPHPDHGGMLAQLLGSARLYRDYDVYPGAFFYGVAVHKHARPLRALFARTWARTYPDVPLGDHLATAPPGTGADDAASDSVNLRP